MQILTLEYRRDWLSSTLYLIYFKVTTTVIKWKNIKKLKFYFTCFDFPKIQ